MEERVHGAQDTHARDSDGEVYLTCLVEQGVRVAGSNDGVNTTPPRSEGKK